MTDVVDIWNQALRVGGVPMRVEEFYEGSDAAKVGLELYSQTRDELFDAKDWAFTRRKVALTLLKGPPPSGGYSFATPWSPIYPAPGFLYEYAYPDDCISLKAIISPPGPMPDLDPLPALWRIDNDQTPIVSGNPLTASGPPRKVILCNATNAIGVYRAQITDPETWEPGFVMALVASLGKKFAVAFGAPAEQTKEETVEAVTFAQTGSMDRG